jgi:AbrB family looped-hinge helix DNA binding protein
MDGSRVTVKGQVVIPSGIRRRHRIRKGTRVCFLERGRDIVLRPVTDEYFDEVKGMVNTKGRALRALLEYKKEERNG